MKYLSEINSSVKAIPKNSLLHEGEFFTVVNDIPTSDIESSQVGICNIYFALNKYYMSSRFYDYKILNFYKLN